MKSFDQNRALYLIAINPAQIIWSFKADKQKKNHSCSKSEIKTEITWDNQQDKEHLKRKFMFVVWFGHPPNILTLSPQKWPEWLRISTIFCLSFVTLASSQFFPFYFQFVKQNLRLCHNSICCSLISIWLVNIWCSVNLNCNTACNMVELNKLFSVWVRITQLPALFCLYWVYNRSYRPPNTSFVSALYLWMYRQNWQCE